MVSRRSCPYQIYLVWSSYDECTFMMDAHLWWIHIYDEWTFKMNTHLYNYDEINMNTHEYRIIFSDKSPNYLKYKTFYVQKLLYIQHFMNAHYLTNVPLFTNGHYKIHNYTNMCNHQLYEHTNLQKQTQRFCRPYSLFGPRTNEYTAICFYGRIWIIKNARWIRHT